MIVRCRRCSRKRNHPFEVSSRHVAVCPRCGRWDAVEIIGPCGRVIVKTRNRPSAEPRRKHTFYPRAASSVHPGRRVT